jgi:DNA ligase (NAD+)
VGIATECSVLYSDFEEMIEDGAEYNNPRSAVPGILSEDGISLSEYLTLIPFKLMIKDKLPNRELEIKLLTEILPYFSKDKTFNITKINTKLQSIEEIYTNTIQNRFNLPFMIDGLVIECANEKLRTSLGYTDNRPNFAIALKLPYIEAKTKITNLEWFTEGNSARYTPVVYFEPVVINNNTYRKVSLSNLKRVTNLKPFIGQEAIFTLRGDVLGYIDPISNDNEYNESFKMITHCEFCKEPLTISSTNTFIYCDNTECELAILGTLQNFLEKHNIKGIKRNTLKSLYDANLLNSIEGLFSLNYKKITSLPGFGEKSSNIIKQALTYFDEPCWDYKVLGSLNIPFFSVKRAQQVLECIGFEEFIDLICKENSSYLVKRLTQFTGFKEKLSNHIYNGFTKANLELLSFLIESLEIKFTTTNDEKSDSGEKSLNICVTGSVTQFKTRKDLEEVLSNKGHKLVSKVTSTTDILMTNDPNTDTDKNRAAKKLNTKVLSEIELIKYLNLKD